MHIPGFRRTREADAILSRIERRVILMSANIARLAAVVASIGTSVGVVARALRDHPDVPTEDDIELGNLVTELEASASQLQDVANQVAGESGQSVSSAPVEPNLTAGTPSEAPVDNAELQGGATLGSTDSTEQPLTGGTISADEAANEAEATTDEGPEAEDDTGEGPPPAA